MSGKTGIEWTETTWNPTVGCSLMSPGCTNCYAMKVAFRLQHNKKLNDPAYRNVAKKVKGNIVWTNVVHFSERAILKPLRWRMPRVVFVNSMSDTFHVAVPPSDIARIWAVMALTPHHTYQVLTKRPDRMLSWITDSNTRLLVEDAMDKIRPGARVSAWPLKNVWVGTSVEDQDRADDRIPLIAQVPAAVRFLSVEPLLGPVSLKAATAKKRSLLKKIDWVIVGGESGSRARPMHPAWPRQVRDECEVAGIPLFFKQVGSWRWGMPQKSGETAKGLMPDGRIVALGTAGSQSIVKGSKKSGGRLLDGQMHEAMPRVR
jgi:protein gp37